MAIFFTNNIKYELYVATVGLKSNSAPVNLLAFRRIEATRADKKISTVQAQTMAIR
jgi:hypothetical protein